MDLHGLYTQEAITKTEEEIAMRQRRGDQTVRVIVGKGIHSKGHVAHIKPAIEQLMQKYGLQAHLDPKNSGVLVVDLTGQQGGAFGRDAGGFTRGLAEHATGKDDQVSEGVARVVRKRASDTDFTSCFLFIRSVWSCNRVINSNTQIPSLRM